MKETPKTGDRQFPVLKYTVQLFYSPIEVGDPPTQIASGVLIKKAYRHLLLTCKHVFDSIKLEDVVILTFKGYAVRLTGQATFINNKNDSIDLALIEFDPLQVLELKSVYSFLAAKNLAFKHQFDEELFYMFFGFINKKTTRKGNEFYSGSFGFLTNFRRYRKIEKMGFNYINNVTLEYTIRKQTYLDDDTVRTFGPRDLRGLSGGGIWLSVAGKRPGTFNYLLVGIMIEERIDKGFIIGTQIHLIEPLLSRNGDNS